MTDKEKMERALNENLLIIGAKISALKHALTPEGLDKYNRYIVYEKNRIQSLLESSHTREQVDAVLKNLDD